MRFEWTPQFDADLNRLSDSEHELFGKVAKEDFSPACDRHRADPPQARPRRLRVKHVTGTEGVFEMTWSFAGPDGRATFEWVMIGDEVGIRWRRIGGHAIFKNP